MLWNELSRIKLRPVALYEKQVNTKCYSRTLSLWRTSQPPLDHCDPGWLPFSVLVSGSHLHQQMLYPGVKEGRFCSRIQLAGSLWLGFSLLSFQRVCSSPFHGFSSRLTTEMGERPLEYCSCFRNKSLWYY